MGGKGDGSPRRLEWSSQENKKNHKLLKKEGGYLWSITLSNSLC